MAALLMLEDVSSLSFPSLILFCNPGYFALPSTTNFPTLNQVKRTLLGLPFASVLPKT